MRKYMIAAAVFGMAVTGRAEMIGTPAGPAQALATADYGGVSISTNGLFNSAQNFVGSGRFRIYGVIFSSGPGDSFVTFSDTGSIVGSPKEVFRLYNSSNATSGSTTGTEQLLRYPVRFNDGFSWKADKAIHNSIQVLYWKEQ